MKDTVIPFFKQHPVTTGGIHIHAIGVNNPDLHQEDVYLLFLLQKGHCIMEINGQPVHIATPSFAFIHPGQVHVLKEADNLQGWLISVETFLIPSACTTLFKSLPVSWQCQPLDTDTFHMQEQLSLLLFQQFRQPSRFHNNILHSLLETFLHTAAACYPAGNIQATQTEPERITHLFKEVLADKGRSMPTPESMARELNISAGYLSYCVHTATGLSVSHWIADTVLTEAKRILYYTALHIREVAYELGFENDFLFSRFFKRHTGITPPVFRNKFR
jgi:AraC-like DNA-binding protein